MSGPSDPATTQTPAPGPTPSRTAAPPVLQQRAPSIRYIDAKQSDAIMESGTKSATVSQLPASGQRCLLYLQVQFGNKHRYGKSASCTLHIGGPHMSTKASGRLHCYAESACLQLRQGCWALLK